MYEYDQDKAIKNSDSFAFNDQFTSPMRVVRLLCVRTYTSYDV